MTVLEAYAAVLAAGFVAGALLLAAGLRGTADAPAPPPAPAAQLARWWRGTGRTAAQRRARQATLAGGGVAGLAVLLTTGVPAAAILAAVAVPALPGLWSAGRAERRAIARADAVAEWTRRLADHLSTGTGLVAALVSSAQTAPAAIAEQVDALATRIRAGTPARQALLRFAEEVDDTVAEQVAAALLLHLDDRGQHLLEVLAALSADAARVVSMRREIDARRAQPRLTIRFMIVLVGVVTLALWQLGLLAAYRTPAGQLLLLTGAGGFAAVLVWVQNLTRPPAAVRLLPAARAG